MSEYIKLNSDEAQEKVNLIMKLWHKFLEETIPAYVEEYKSMGLRGFNFKNCEYTDAGYVNSMALREVFERVHQREDYFIRYHDHLKMSNYKEIGLISFWIVKLKPFHLKEDCFDDFYDFRVNEEFALYFIFNSIARYARKRKVTCNINRINQDLYNELLYTMQYRDLSKEAYGCLVELISIATDCE